MKDIHHVICVTWATILFNHVLRVSEPWSIKINQRFRLDWVPVFLPLWNELRMAPYEDEWKGVLLDVSVMASYLRCLPASRYRGGWDGTRGYRSACRIYVPKHLNTDTPVAGHFTERCCFILYQRVIINAGSESTRWRHQNQVWVSGDSGKIDYTSRFTSCGRSSKAQNSPRTQWLCWYHAL